MYIIIAMNLNLILIKCKVYEPTLMVHNFVAVLTELEVRGKTIQSLALQRPHSASGPVVYLASECSISTQTL